MSITIDIETILNYIHNDIFIRLSSFILLVLLSIVFVGYFTRIVYFVIVKSFKINLNDENLSVRELIDLNDKKAALSAVSFGISCLTYIPIFIKIFRVLYYEH